MANLTLWPAYVDDSGDGQSGTAGTKAFFDSLATAIRAEVYNAANPLVTPASIIGEVVTARGTTASLNARLSTVIAADGSFIVPTGAVTQAVAQTFAHNRNWLRNDTFLVWPNVLPLTLPPTQGPAGWVLTGAGATVERAGVGCVDGSNAKIGRWWAKVIRAAADVEFTQNVLSATAVSRIPELKTNLKLSVGAWVKSDAANRARLMIWDGVGRTYSSYHTGSGNWEFLAIPAFAVAPTMTVLDLSLLLENSAGYAGISGPVLCWSDLGVSRWAPGPISRGIIKETFPGVLAAGGDQRRIQVPCPCLVTYVQLRCGTAPVGGNIVVDVNSYYAAGPSWNSMFQAGDRPTIVAADQYGGHAPTYVDAVATTAGAFTNACVVPFWGNAGAIVPPGHSELSIDIDSVGAGGTEGSDLDVYLHVLGFPSRDIEHFADYDDI